MVWLFVTPMDCSPPGSSVCGILQARILERVDMPSSRGSSRPWDWALVSCIGRQILYHCITREDVGLSWFCQICSTLDPDMCRLPAPSPGKPQMQRHCFYFTLVSWRIMFWCFSLPWSFVSDFNVWIMFRSDWKDLSVHLQKEHPIPTEI